MYKYLTLAIREVRPNVNEFAVVIMEMHSGEFRSFFFEKDEIISTEGEVFWDIGFVTTMKDPPPDKDSRSKPTGFMNIEDARSSLKSILDSKTAYAGAFFANENIEYTIVKAKNVSDITVAEKDGKIQSRMKVAIEGGFLPPQQQWLLNKDYRWIEYWKHIYEKDTVVEKKKQYIQLFNQHSKTLYLLLYRHTFRDGNKQLWIAGMHWL